MTTMAVVVVIFMMMTDGHDDDVDINARGDDTGNDDADDEGYSDDWTMPEAMTPKVPTDSAYMPV